MPLMGSQDLNPAAKQLGREVWRLMWVPLRRKNESKHAAGKWSPFATAEPSCRSDDKQKRHAPSFGWLSVEIGDVERDLRLRAVWIAGYGDLGVPPR
jgi:hypothetical protein